jgi:hypothetical protein
MGTNLFPCSLAYSEQGFKFQECGGFAMKTYKAAFLHKDTGALECGFEVQADTDTMAVLLARTEQHRRHGIMELVGLHEVTGKATNGMDLIRVVDY